MNEKEIEAQKQQEVISNMTKIIEANP